MVNGSSALPTKINALKESLDKGVLKWFVIVAVLAAILIGLFAGKVIGFENPKKSSQNQNEPFVNESSMGMLIGGVVCVFLALVWYASSGKRDSFPWIMVTLFTVGGVLTVVGGVSM